MQLVPVQSSRIKALGYDEDTWTCYVQFQPMKRELKGTVYAYANVTPEMFERFQKAPSKGHYFGQHLANKDAHPALRLGEPHTPRKRATESSGVLVFRPAKKTVSATGKASRNSQASVRASGYHPGSEELVRLSHERELLLEFFRPMRESTLAAYRAVIAKEEEALAEFRAAEAALATPLQGNGKRAHNSNK